MKSVEGWSTVSFSHGETQTGPKSEILTLFINHSFGTVSYKFRLLT